MNLQDAVRKIFEPFASQKSSPQNRAILEERLNYYFESLDKRGYPRPKDFNISIGENGETEVFFSKEFTGD